MKITTLLGTAALGLFALSGTPANAAAWCAYQGGMNQYENCGYYTYAQCRAAVRGVGGDCRRNPYGAYDRGYRGGLMISGLKLVARS